MRSVPFLGAGFGGGVGAAAVGDILETGVVVEGDGVATTGILGS